MSKNFRIENIEPDLSKSASKGYNISLCSKKGKKPDQQDSGFVGILPNFDEQKNAEEILQEAIKKTELNHKECLKGTTICSAIVSNQSIVVANLGDSRAAGIFRVKGFFGDRFISVLFSQDHDFSVQRVRKYVEERGGIISFDRGIEVVNGKLEMGAAIGDRSVVGENQKDCLIREPDIFSFDLESLCKKIGVKKSDVIDLDLMVSCDGLWNLKNGKMKCDFEVDIKKNGEQELKNNASYFSKFSFRKNLSDIKKSYNSYLNKIGSEKESESFANFACQYALKNGSRDNVSVAHLTYFKNKQLNDLLASDQKIIATICDGHGIGMEYSKKVPKSVSEIDKKDWGGENISNSVAADIYTIFRVNPILGLEIDPKEQGCLHELIALRGSKTNVESFAIDDEQLDKNLKVFADDNQPSTSPVLKKKENQFSSIKEQQI